MARAVPAQAATAVITSPTNATLTFVRSLQRRAVRAEERAFVVEGRRAVADALAAGAVPRLILVRAGTDHGLRLDARSHPRPRLVAPRLFDRLAETVSPQGVLAVFPFPELAPPAAAATPLILVIDRLRDPGNAGTLLRTAAGAGVTLVWYSPATVDPFNPKVVRAAMGAHFRLPLRPLDDAALAELRGYPLRVATIPTARRPYDALDWRQPAVIIIGAEAEGVSPELAALASERVAIPLAAGVESLNAAVAGAVILFEAARQRRSLSSARGTGGVPAGGEGIDKPAHGGRLRGQPGGDSGGETIARTIVGGGMRSA